MKQVLYIEDDEVDLLWWQRITRTEQNISTTFKESLSDVAGVDLSAFDLIICDANLPDADFKSLKDYFKNETHVHFLSGALIEGERIIEKPISLSHILALLEPEVIDLSYIKTLSEGDVVYEQEMIRTALKVMPDRLKLLREMGYDITKIRTAAHKAKSSFRVCGMDSTALEVLEDLGEGTFERKKVDELFDKIERQILSALRDLETYLS